MYTGLEPDYEEPLFLLSEVLVAVFSHEEDSMVHQSDSNDAHRNPNKVYLQSLWVCSNTTSWFRYKPKSWFNLFMVCETRTQHSDDLTFLECLDKI